MHWYFEAMRKYAVFNGRARRKEYWMFALVNGLIVLAIVVAENIVGIADPEAGYGIVGILYTLAVFLPGLAVSVRRLHDTDRSGWWVLIGLIPIIGFIVLLVFYVSDSQPGPNRFGENPKEATA